MRYLRDPTGDPVYNLVYSVVRQAVHDAQAGDEEAIGWLWICAPDLAARLRLPMVEALPVDVVQCD